MRIVFMGTPDFAVPSLERLIADGHEIIAVVTQPDRPKCRGMKLAYSAVKECALKYNLPVYQPEKIRTDDEFKEMYKSLKPDLTVVVAFGQILPKDVLEVPSKGNINVHGSLLPKYRGAAPIQWSVIKGEKVTGVTTMYMDEGMDTGDMILKREVLIEKNETAGELYDRLRIIGADLLSETIKLVENNTVIREKQDDNEATYAPMMNKEIGRIDFNKSSHEIECLIRGTNPWPSAFCEINGKKFKVYEAEIIDERGNPGEIICADPKKGLKIGTGDGALEFISIQPECKKRMTAKEYLLGNKIN